MLLDGKVAIVTGGSRGIGKAIVLELAKAGAKLVVNYAGNAAAANTVCEEIKAAGGEAIAVQADVADTASVEAMIKQAVGHYGRIDILVNNAGITRDNLLMRMKEDDWDAVIGTNLKGIFNTAKAVAKTMMKQRYGRIVNISSVVGQTGNAGQTNYSAAKAGIFGFTKSLARELSTRGINVNAVAPGYIATDMSSALSEEVKAEWERTIPLGRLGMPEDVAKAVLFLVSDYANYITGQTLNVDGGMVMY